MNLTKSAVWGIAAAAFSLGFGSTAQAQSERPGEASEVDTGRVSAIVGTLYGRGPYDTETSELSPNAVLRGGDEVFTEDGTFAEVEFPGGTFLRLAGATTVVIQRIGDDGIEIALADGAAYLSRGPNAAPARFQSFAGTVDLGGGSMARVENDAARTTFMVSVADGSAELRNDDTAIAVRNGQTLRWTREKTRTDGFDASRGDGFDQWNAEREALVRGTARPSHVPAGVVGAYELEGSGTWVVIDGHRAWRPSAVGPDWRPYRDGYWDWCEPYGWTWVSYEPWGYTTSHYGRWYYRSHYGWVWYPGRTWGPAWVVWAAFGSYIGWAPCDFWGRPIYVHSYYSYYDYGAWCYTSSYYFHYGAGYNYYGNYKPQRDRNITTSTYREASGSQNAGRYAARGERGIGRNNEFRIQTFDERTIREHTPVPVRDPQRELTPKHIVAAAERGQLEGVPKQARQGDLLARAVREGGVRPEPWKREEIGRERLLDRSGADRDAARGLDRPTDPARGAGWQPRGAERDATRQPDRAPARGPGFGEGGTFDRRTQDRGTKDRSPTRSPGLDRVPQRDDSPRTAPPARTQPRTSPPERSSPPPTRTAPPERSSPPPSRSAPPKRSPPPSRPPPKSDDSRKSRDDKRSGWHIPGASGTAAASTRSSGFSSSNGRHDAARVETRRPSSPSWGSSRSSSGLRTTPRIERKASSPAPARSAFNPPTRKSSNPAPTRSFTTPKPAKRSSSVKSSGSSSRSSSVKRSSGSSSRSSSSGSSRSGGSSKRGGRKR